MFPVCLFYYREVKRIHVSELYENVIEKDSERLQFDSNTSITNSNILRINR